MVAGQARPLDGYTIALLEARRSDEIARLIELQGGTPLVAPALREVPVEDDSELRAWLDRLANRQFDVVIFLTGVGCRALLDRARDYATLDRVLSALAAARVVARGPKPVKVLKELDVRIDFVPPEPNTSDELLAELSHWQLAGKSIGLQVYGGVTPFLERLRDGLAAEQATVHEAHPYRWAGPSDPEAVRKLIAACVDGKVDAIAFFSSSQVHNLFTLAEDHGIDAQLTEALARPDLLIAAVGPVCAEAVRQHGLRVDVEPEHPKMGHLVLALAEAFRDRQDRQPEGDSQPPLSPPSSKPSRAKGRSPNDGEPSG